jgi:hypothetical protein
MPDLADDPEYRLTRRQADQARNDFAMILDELDFVKFQLSRLPTRAWLSRASRGESRRSKPSQACPASRMVGVRSRP